MGNKPAMPDGPGFTIVTKMLKYLMWNSLAINLKSFKTLQICTAGPKQNNNNKKKPSASQMWSQGFFAMTKSLLLPDHVWAVDTAFIL